MSILQCWLTDWASSQHLCIQAFNVILYGFEYAFAIALRYDTGNKTAVIKYAIATICYTSVLQIRGPTNKR